MLERSEACRPQRIAQALGHMAERSEPCDGRSARVYSGSFIKVQLAGPQFMVLYRQIEWLVVILSSAFLVRFYIFGGAISAILFNLGPGQFHLAGHLQLFVFAGPLFNFNCSQSSSQCVGYKLWISRHTEICQFIRASSSFTGGTFFEMLCNVGVYTAMVAQTSLFKCNRCVEQSNVGRQNSLKMYGVYEKARKSKGLTSGDEEMLQILSTQNEPFKNIPLQQQSTQREIADTLQFPYQMSRYTSFLCHLLELCYIVIVSTHLESKANVCGATTQTVGRWCQYNLTELQVQ